MGHRDRFNIFHFKQFKTPPNFIINIQLLLILNFKSFSGVSEEAMEDTQVFL